MHERTLLFGPPGSGKTRQLVNVIKYLEDLGIPVYAIDLEDKMEAMLLGLNESPKNLKLYTAFSWEELKTDNNSVFNQIEKQVKPDQWIAIDRVDLSWPLVQRWYTQQKYNEELATKMLETAKAMKKSSMFIPRFDQGSWQVINEQYESFMLSILYRFRCNVIMTSGVKGADDNAPIDIYAALGVTPRGQKELGHQPHSTFLLFQKKSGRDITWHISTGKDLPNRVQFDKDELFDFSLQYLGLYYPGK